MPRVPSSPTDQANKYARERKEKKNCCFVLAETRRDEATRGRFSDPSSQSPHVSFRFVWVLPPSILTRSFPSSLPTCRRLPVARSRGGSGLRYTRPSPSLVRIIVVGSVGFVAFDGITRSVVFAGFFFFFFCYSCPRGLDRSVGIWMQNVANTRWFGCRLSRALLSRCYPRLRAGGFWDRG